VNVGDPMSRISDGKFKATFHMVRSMLSQGEVFGAVFLSSRALGCVVRGLDELGDAPGMVYGEHVLGKMSAWVEFQDVRKGGDVVERVDC